MVYDVLYRKSYHVLKERSINPQINQKIETGKTSLTLKPNNLSSNKGRDKAPQVACLVQWIQFSAGALNHFQFGYKSNGP